MATDDFNGSYIKSENDKEQILRYDLQGFKPSNGSHSCFAKVSSNGELITEAKMGSNTYQDVIEDSGLTNGAATAKGLNNHVDVYITKPDPNYSIISKLNQ